MLVIEGLTHAKVSNEQSFLSGDELCPPGGELSADGRDHLLQSVLGLIHSQQVARFARSRVG